MARRAGDWEVALGYIAEQQVVVHTSSTVCPWEGAPPEFCSTETERSHQSVDPYAYLSVQRRFEFRREALLRPVFGLGLVGQTDTNPYVSTILNFSLSLGVGIGERVALEWRHFSNADIEGPNLGQDTILLRWTLR